MEDTENNKKAALIILDGWGHGKDPLRSAIANADTPFVDSMYTSLPNAELVTFGGDVGLPEGQMGNSEVGHLNIGAGRIVYQELARINKSIRDGEFEENQVIKDLISYASRTGKPIHLCGLVSDGGVHSHIEHLIGICKILNKYPDIEVKIHAFLDGRDTAPDSGVSFLKELEDAITSSNCRLISVIGRYYAMDRDKRWERIEKAYNLLVKGVGERSNDLLSSVKEKYNAGISDEFMDPIIALNASVEDLIKDGDAVLFFNFRTDRPRQLTEVLTQQDYPEYNMCKMSLYYCTMTEYHKEYEGINVVFVKEDLKNTIGEVLSSHKRKQVRIAETEKYPHVTFFFNGGREQPFEGESRILIDSPKVTTYDLQPEMSAFEVTDAITEYVDKENPDYVCLNYANADMVGHTGIMEAAMKAVETVDTCLSRLMKTLGEHNYYFIVIADHGNADIMVNEDGSPHTAHTTNMVPVFIGGPGISRATHVVNNGKLGDIATTLLSIMGVDIPNEMKGNILLHNKER